jgi:translation initiation factor IF-3
VKETGKRLRINDFIRISPIRLIDENNEQIGVIDLDEAKRRAREAGQDLVEVSPTTRPPVCRIMDYGKWKYQQKKKEQKARSHSKHSELKEVRLKPGIDVHDRDIKTKHAREFLDDGHKVQFTLTFKGREMAHQELGLQVLVAIRDNLANCSKVESEPKLMGRRMTMTLAPERKAKPGEAVAGAPAPAAGTSAPKPAAGAGGLAPRPQASAPAPAAAPAARPAPAAPAAAPAPAATQPAGNGPVKN